MLGEHSVDAIGVVHGVLIGDEAWWRVVDVDGIPADNVNRLEFLRTVLFAQESAASGAGAGAATVADDALRVAPPLTVRVGFGKVWTLSQSQQPSAFTDGVLAAMSASGLYVDQESARRLASVSLFVCLTRLTRSYACR